MSRIAHHEPDKVPIFMSSDSNPYAVTSVETSFAGDPAFSLRQAKMVHQVPVVAILQIVLGGLELLAAFALIGFAVFMPPLMANLDQDSKTPPPPEELLRWIEGMYSAMGGTLAVLAVLRIFAGATAFWFRGRIFMLASLGGGLLSALTCYCAPFSIGLAIYGLVVMLNPGVVKAYQMAGAGVSAADIRKHFSVMTAGNVSPPIDNPAEQ
jgi:hypothetical protein